jgi:rfaE bifunctional protein kinase chain/domain
MQPLDIRQLDDLLSRFKDLHILVVGDFFLDKYLIIDRELKEISLETGLEAHQIVSVHSSPGAAGTVTSNLRALGVQVSVLGIIGDDGNGYELKKGLLSRGVNIDSLLEVDDRFTPTYTKPIVRETDGVEHEIERQDTKNREPMDPGVEAKMIDQLNAFVTEVDAVILVDQVQEPNCGVITDQVRSEIGALAIRYPDVVIAADSRTRIGLFENVIIKPNYREALLTVHPTVPQRVEIKDLETVGKAFYQKNQRPVFITHGSNGILIFTETGCAHVPAIPVSGPVDIVGAGDSCMAGIVTSLSCGVEPAQAAFLGNLAASITIQQIGTTGTASQTQIREHFLKVTAQFSR